MRINNLEGSSHFYNKATIISFLCSLMVMWIHTYNLDTYGISANHKGGAEGIAYVVETYWSHVVLVAVPFFFAISGFLFFRTFTLRKTWSKYKSRIHSIVIPYLLWCSIYYFFFVFCTNVPLFSKLVNAKVVKLSFKNYLMALWPSQYYTLWFLKDLIILIILSPIFFCLLKDYGRIKSGLLLLTFLMLNGYFGWTNFGIGGLNYYCFGAYFAINFKEISEKRKDWRIVVVCAVGTALLLTLGYRLLSVQLVQICAIVLIWNAMDAFEFACELPWWMKITFFVYVAHDIVLESLEKVFLIVFGTSPIFALLDYIFMPTITFAVIVVIAGCLRRFLPFVWKILTGGRE